MYNLAEQQLSGDVTMSNVLYQEKECVSRVEGSLSQYWN